MTLDTLLTNRPALKFDRYDRYLIPHPETGAEQAWTRASTVAKTLDDNYHLNGWKLRMTGKGIAIRHDLHALAAATDIDDKRAWRSIVDQAQDAALAGANRNIGTALHAFTERLDSGETLESINAPEPWAADLVAYQETLADAGISVVSGMTEVVVTLPDFGIAGQLDRILGLEGCKLPVIGDLKTGGFLNFQSFTIQCAIYTNARTIFDPSTGTHSPMPPVDLERALIIHLPAGQAKCDLYWVDIAAGWEAAKLALDVRAWRSRKDLHTAFAATPKDATAQEPVTVPELVESGTSSKPAPDPATAESVPAEGLQPLPANHGLATMATDSAPSQPAYLTDLAAVRERVHSLIAAGHGEELAGLWPLDHPTLKEGGLTQAQLYTIARICGDVEREHSRPFHESSEATPEFVAGDDPAVVDLVARLRALPSDIASEVVAEAAKCSVPKLSSGRATPTDIHFVSGEVFSAEERSSDRAHTVRTMLAPYDDCTTGGDDVITSLLDTAAPRDGKTDWHDLTAAEVDNLRTLIKAIDLCVVGLTYEGERPVLMTTEQADAYIAERYDSRKAAVVAAGTHSERLGRKRKPRSMPEVLKDPLLVVGVAMIDLPDISTYEA